MPIKTNSHGCLSGPLNQSLSSIVIIPDLRDLKYIPYEPLNHIVSLPPLPHKSVPSSLCVRHSHPAAPVPPGWRSWTEEADYVV